LSCYCSLAVFKIIMARDFCPIMLLLLIEL
jgi:hypothetical protein